MTIPNIPPGTKVRPKFQIKLSRPNEPADEYHTWHPSEAGVVANWVRAGHREMTILQKYSKDWVPVVLWGEVWSIPLERLDVRDE